MWNKIAYTTKIMDNNGLYKKSDILFREAVNEDKIQQLKELNIDPDKFSEEFADYIGGKIYLHNDPNKPNPDYNHIYRPVEDMYSNNSDDLFEKSKEHTSFFVLHNGQIMSLPYHHSDSLIRYLRSIPNPTLYDIFDHLGAYSFANHALKGAIRFYSGSEDNNITIFDQITHQQALALSELMNKFKYYRGDYDDYDNMEYELKDTTIDVNYNGHRIIDYEIISSKDELYRVINQANNEILKIKQDENSDPSRMRNIETLRSFLQHNFSNKDARMREVVRSLPEIPSDIIKKLVENYSKNPTQVVKNYYKERTAQNKKAEEG